jgi:hypothetical protein
MMVVVLELRGKMRLLYTRRHGFDVTVPVNISYHGGGRTMAT